MKTLLILHGAIGAKTQLFPLKEALNKHYNCHLLNFEGHGKDANLPKTLSIEGFAKNVLHYMEQHQITKADIFGYSMGGYVGLFLARHYPEKANKIFTLASKFNWDEQSATKESRMLDPAIIEQKVPHFARTLRERHSNWKGLLEKTANMMLHMGQQPPLQQADFEKISHSIRIATGDKDTMVPPEETLEVFRMLPNATYCVFSNTAHPIEKYDVKKLSGEIIDFFN